VHGTVVSVDGKGVLLRGPSGSGKSDLALRLIDGGAVLVADDRVVLTRDAGQISASAPEAILGRLEVRGLGIVRLAASQQAPLFLVVDLVEVGIERLPAPETIDLLGIPLLLIRMSPFEASAPAKIRLAVRTEGRDIER
jgi:serine kinase of HPr protein (carbohydrate metabolism regulator)